MKRILSVVTACCIALLMCACGNTSSQIAEEVPSAPESSVSSAAEPIQEPAPEEEPEVHKHSFGEWEVVTAATCTEDGEEVRTCAECGETETQAIPAAGHKFAPATCFLPKTCSECGETEGEPLATTISSGETVSAEDHSFYIADTYYASKLSEKNGNITHSYGNDGHYLIIKLSFTNLATEAMDDFNSNRVSDIQLVYGNKYAYEGDFVILSDDIVPLATGNAYLLFAVPDSMENDAEKSLYTTFTIDGLQYAYVVSWGDGSDWDTSAASDEEASDGTASETAAVDSSPSDLFIGDTKSGAEFEFTLTDAYFTTKLSEKNGSTTYSYGDDGYYLVFQLAFTNLATEAMEKFQPSRVSNMQLTFNEKYNYDGEARILVDDIVPLGTGNLYILFSVPDTINGGSDPLTAVFEVDGMEFHLDCRANGL